MDDSSYAPQSPDLSAYHSSASFAQDSASAFIPQQQQQQQQQQRQHYQHHQHHSHPHQSYHQPYQYQQQPTQQQPYQFFDTSSPFYPPAHQQPQRQSHDHIVPDHNQHHMATGNGHGRGLGDDEWLPSGAAGAAGAAGSTGSTGRRSRRAGAGAVPSNANSAAIATGAASMPGFENVEVKTKFPVARIKRIMQADEDVGKVAQVTPVVVSKALELFMISLVVKAASEARARSSKRITAAHLKAAVAKDEQFDFLNMIIEKVPDGPAASDSKGGAGNDDDDASGGGGSGTGTGSAPEAGRRRRGGGSTSGPGRKKRRDSNDF